MNLGQRNQVQAGGNMSSMTDLVFLLLIFFVILSTLVSNGVNVDLPQSKGTSSASSRLTVSIKPDGTYYLNGTAIARADIEPALKVKFADQSDPVLIGRSCSAPSPRVDPPLTPETPRCPDSIGTASTPTRSARNAARRPCSPR